MLLFRGFACAEEAIYVLKNKTAGGVFVRPAGAEDNVLEKINEQKGSFAEGIRRIMQKSTKDRKGIIEYTTSEDISLNFGTLCTICIDVNETSIIQESINERDPEKGVFLYIDTPVNIDSFVLGYYYYEYNQLDKIFSKFRPIGPKIPVDINNTDINVMNYFISQCKTLGYNIIDKTQK